MKVGDLVYDKELDELAVIEKVDFHWFYLVSTVTGEQWIVSKLCIGELEALCK